MGRGQWQSALSLYEELANHDPKDGTWPLRAGDAARRLGNHREAITWYERAAATYGERGFVVRAIAVGKMIQSLDPGNDRILRALDADQKQRSTATPPPREIVKPPPLPKKSSTKKKAPPPLPSSPRAGQKERKKGPPPLPPLSKHLSGPPLTPVPAQSELSMRSMEIVFDDLEDGIPIQAADILGADDIIEVITCEDEMSEEALLAKLPSFPLFQVLPKGAFMSIASKMEYSVVEPGEVVVSQGELGTSLFAIIEGEVLVYLDGHRDEPLARLSAGDVFGEMALVLDQPRTANVEAVTVVELFEMDRALFTSVLDSTPELGFTLSRMIKRRLVENTMATAPLFQRLDPSMRQEMMLRFQVREVTAGTKLVEQGTPSDGLYLVLNGSVEALKDDRVTKTLTPGQTFGVASLIDSAHQSPTGFQAPVNSMVLRLPRAAFHEVISCYPPVLEHLAEVAEQQMSWDDSVPVV